MDVCFLYDSCTKGATSVHLWCSIETLLPNVAFNLFFFIHEKISSSVV